MQKLWKKVQWNNISIECCAIFNTQGKLLLSTIQCAFRSCPETLYKLTDCYGMLQCMDSMIWVPFYFHQDKVIFICLYTDGQPAPSKPLMPNFIGGYYKKPYYGLFSELYHETGIYLTEKNLPRARNICFLSLTRYV